MKKCDLCGLSKQASQVREHEGAIYCHSTADFAHHPTCWERVTWHDAMYASLFPASA